MSKTVNGGAAHRRKSGLKSVSCDLPPDDYEVVRQAAFDCRKSMAAFARDAVVDAAQKNKKKNPK